MTCVRSMATALLDSTSEVEIAEHVNTAAAFVACFRSGGRLDAWSLVQLLTAATGDSQQATRAASVLAKLSRYPVEALAWAWADQGTGEGQLNCRGSTRPRAGLHPWSQSEITGMGAVLGWMTPPRVHRGIVVLSGQTGAGKTVPAVFAAVQHGGHFIRAAEIGEMALSSSAALKALTCVPFLIIDELGRESDVRPTPARMTELLGARDGLGTLVTTQLPRHDFGAGGETVAGFESRYGHHIIDRVDRAGRWFDLRQPSRRTTVQPRLTGLRRSCRIADLLPKVETLTGPTERPDEKAFGVIRELQQLLGISDEALAEAESKRRVWMAPLREQAAKIGGFAGAVILDRLNGVSAPDETRRPEAVDG